MNWYHEETNPHFCCFDQCCRGGCSCITPRTFCDAWQLSTLLLLPLLLDWHGRSWHRQAGEAFTDFGTAEHSLHRKGRFWSAVPQLCARSHLRGQQATVLAMDWWGKDRNSTCPNAFTLPVTQIPKMIQAKLSCVGSSLVMWNCSLYTLVAIWARAAFLV